MPYIGQKGRYIMLVSFTCTECGHKIYKMAWSGSVESFKRALKDRNMVCYYCMDRNTGQVQEGDPLYCTDCKVKAPVKGGYFDQNLGEVYTWKCGKCGKLLDEAV